MLIIKDSIGEVSLIISDQVINPPRLSVNKCCTGDSNCLDY